LNEIWYSHVECELNADGGGVVEIEIGEFQYGGRLFFFQTGSSVITAVD